MAPPNTTPSPLRQARWDHGLTLRALAKRCRESGTQVSAGQLSKLERGKYQPRPELRALLANLLGLDINLQTPADRK